MNDAIKMAVGGWLAVTTEPVPIGVFGSTKADALARLDAAVAERRELRLAATAP